MHPLCLLHSLLASSLPLLLCSNEPFLHCLISVLILPQSPAPWTAEGKKVAKKLGLTMQYPEGYLEAIQQSAASSGEESNKGKGRKRKSSSKWLCGVAY